MSRRVFKIVGSFGPGGAIACLVEHVCSAMFADGYDMIDPRTAGATMKAEEAKE